MEKSWVGEMISYLWIFFSQGKSGGFYTLDCHCDRKGAAKQYVLCKCQTAELILSVRQKWV